MKKIKAFSLIEVVLALLILSIIVVSFMPALAHVEKTKTALNKKDELYFQAKNAMESAIARQDCQDCDLVEIKISTYSDKLEKIEIYERNTEKVLLFSLRQKESIYSN